MKLKRRNATVLKWLLLVFLMVYAVGMTVWASGKEKSQICPGVEVRVNSARPGTEGTIRHGVEEHLGKLVSIKGKRVGDINLNRVQRWMDGLNNLERATCVFMPDGRLVIEVDALVPEMRVFAPGGNSYYINHEGKRMTALPEFFTDVPVVTGNFNKSFTETSLLPLVRTISADEMLNALITQIDARSPHEIILVPRIQGHVIELGDTSHLSAKLTALKTFYRKVMPARGWQTYEKISVKYTGRVVATLRNKPVMPAVTADSIPDVEEQALQQSELEAPLHPAPLTNRQP